MEHYRYSGSNRLEAMHFGTIAVAVMLSISLAALTGCGPSKDMTASAPTLTEDMIVNLPDVEVVPLTELNSPQDDFGITVPLDSTLAFSTSGRSGALGVHSIFSSRKSSGKWSVPSLAVIINNNQSNGLPSLLPGGTALYFAGCDYGLGDCDLYVVEAGLRGAVSEKSIPWDIPTNLGLGINGAYWDSQPCISADGSTLYFSSDRAGGLGGKDIWVCVRKKDGTWGTPVNAGERVNTTFDEITPWISPDNQTLFFSSNGHPGIGGLDVFAVSIKATEGERVVNLGTPINSSSNEIGFSLSASGQEAFVASDRSGGLGGYDLYSVHNAPVDIDPIMIVHGTVKNVEGAPLYANIEVIDLVTNYSLGKTRVNLDNGEYSLILERGGNYGITAQAPGHLFNTKQVRIPSDLEQLSHRALDFTLQPITGSVRLLVFFETGESLLERESIADLDRTVRFLEANPDVAIEISGHTDNVGDPQANLQLSVDRAQAVKSYLVGNRVEADRIKVVGYGAAQSVASNTTEEGRARNRRVEMRILPPH